MNKVYAVGIGPGDREFFTEEAIEALRQADVIAGYTVYVDLVKDLFPEKATFSTPMMKEIERCRWAIETARDGKTVAMVCSGDAGVYGMAGLLFELADQYNLDSDAGNAGNQGSCDADSQAEGNAKSEVEVEVVTCEFHNDANLIGAFMTYLNEINPANE